jgi:uncharacterized cupredoxin-like copper-binding protein
VKVRLAGGVSLAALVALLGTLTATAALAEVTARSTITPTKITVTANEFYFTLSKKSIPKPGVVAFTVINRGKIAHNFDVQRLSKKTKLLQPGQRQTLIVTFKKKGSYYYLCTVPRHAQEGMAGSFIVR